MLVLCLEMISLHIGAVDVAVVLNESFQFILDDRVPEF